MQAETRNEFTNRMEEARKAYDRAHRSYEKKDGTPNVGRMLRCHALAKYLGHWLTPNPDEKKALLEECWRLTKEAFNLFERSGDQRECFETYSTLSSAAYYNYQFQWAYQRSEKILQEAIDYGERTITLLSTSNIPPKISLTRAYAKTAVYLTVITHYFSPDIDEYERYYRKARSYFEKAYGLAADAALLELLTVSHDFDHLFSFKELLVHYEEALDYARITRDRYLIGTALDMLGYATFWKSVGTEDPDERQKLAQSALHYSKVAKQHFSAISVISPRYGVLWPEAPYCDYYWQLALYETDLKKKRDLLNEASLDGAYAVELAKSSGYPGILTGSHHAVSKALESLAQIAPSGEKRQLLEKALDHRTECCRLEEQLFSSDYWNRGVFLHYLAGVKAELADLEKNSQNKTSLLAEAVSDKKRGIQLCVKTIRWFEKVRDIAEYYPLLGRFQSSYGELLNRLYQLTDNNELQRRAIQALEEAAETYLKLGMVSHMAECYWKVGRLYDDLQEHLKAAENFTLASTYYTHTIERVPQLSDFYRIHASYMAAWSEIEQAKHHHNGKRHEQAQSHYTKAARLYQSTKWSYLSPNYSAWARLEAAEHLSRSERTDDAKQGFQDAAELFQGAKQSIEAKMDSIEDVYERKLASNLIKASNIRHRYCLGRIALEEARLLDQQGRHRDSSEKYGIAANTFQDVANILENERDYQEITPIIHLSKAWQSMTRAEAEVSPALYLQASRHFEQAKEHTTDERARVLATGHSIFCKALEAGIKFETTRDAAVYAEAKKYLVVAENFYVKASFQNASDYARATHRLLDAYWYLYKAETELAPDQKPKYFQLSAKLLQTSSESYLQAKHPEKTEQVQRLLDKVLEEQKLSIALTEILRSPLITLSTESFVTPSQTYEKAVGFERFDHAHIQGNIVIPEYGTVGEAMEWRLDLVNVGKTLGLLIRIDDFIPKDCTVLSAPSRYTVEHRSLNLKGRSLESIKSESIVLSVQARTPGSFTVSPQVIFVDETGAFQSCTPEPVTLLVQPKSAFEFKAKTAKSVFHFLLHAFIEDYMRARLSLETSGWRTYMEIVKYAHVPKSSVYGARGRSGHAIIELEKRGLVETRIFPGERGRGGRIRRIRIAYDKETIKRYVDQHIMEK